MEKNLSAKISCSFLSIHEKNVTCKRDPDPRDRDETETFDFQSETRLRPRRSHISTRPRRDRDVGKMHLETVSRPRRRDRDHIPAACLSVTFRYRDHIGWNTSKTISRPNSVRSLLTMIPTWAIWCNGNTPKIRVE